MGNMTGDIKQQASDPGTPLEVLADLAYQHPELRANIAANPSAYPDLLDWLAQLGDPEVNAAIAGRGLKSDENRAADPDTPPEVLAELAYLHPSLRQTIADNPSAYQGLRDWIAEAGDTSATVVVAEPVHVAVPAASAPAVPKVPLITRINGRFGETFTFTTAVTLALIAVAAIISLIAGSIFIGGVSNLVASGVASISSSMGNSENQAGSPPPNAQATSSADPQQQLADAQTSFDASLSTFSGAQENLKNELAVELQLQTTISASQVADPTTLVKLKTIIDSANAVDTVLPTKATTTTDLLKQVSDLKDRTVSLNSLSSQLNDAGNAVKKSVSVQTVKVLAAKNTHIVTATDSNGNKERITVTVGSWIKGSDTAKLSQAWSAIGGKGDMPIQNNDGFTNGDGAFLFGTVVIENLTTDFPASNFGDGRSFVNLSLSIPHSEAGWGGPTYGADAYRGQMLQARQYTNSTPVDAFSAGKPLVSPDMSSGNRWGPSAFVIGLDKVFTPNYPNGNPNLKDGVFSLVGSMGIKNEGDMTFKVTQTW